MLHAIEASIEAFSEFRTPQATPQATPQVQRLLAVLDGEMTRDALQNARAIKAGAILLGYFNGAVYAEVPGERGGAGSGRFDGVGVGEVNPVAVRAL